MDPVRLGRALGAGTRQAAKNLYEAADAATSPNPNPRPSPPRPPQPSVARTTSTPQRAPQVSANNLAEGSRRFTESFFGRLRRLGGALWLEFTGVFFGIFALGGAQGAWKLRAALHPGADPVLLHKFYVTAGVAVVFGYFCLSSFIRARRKERGKDRKRH